MADPCLSTPCVAVQLEPGGKAQAGFQPPRVPAPESAEPRVAPCSEGTQPADTGRAEQRRLLTQTTGCGQSRQCLPPLRCTRGSHPHQGTWCPALSARIAFRTGAIKYKKESETSRVLQISEPEMPTSSHSHCS